MARTKKVNLDKPVPSKVKVSEKKAVIKAEAGIRDDKFLEEMTVMREENIADIRTKYKLLISKFPKGLLDYTLTDVATGRVQEKDLSVSLLSATTLLNDVTPIVNATGPINSTFNVKTSKSKLNQARVVSKSRSRRSASCDEGYTTESARSPVPTTSGGKNTLREPRSRKKEVGNARQGLARSLSRTGNMSKVDTFVTPLNRNPRPCSAGTITPKVKTNTPLMLMRKPKVGEVAWSNQGSPLMVYAPAISGQPTNVNIPLGEDGVLSLLPQRGALRDSEIPVIPADTRRQLEILRDNLIKMCGVNGSRNE